MKILFIFIYIISSIFVYADKVDSFVVNNGVIPSSSEYRKISKHLEVGHDK